LALIWRGFKQAEIGDSAIWDYMAQSILRGQIPYRDVVEIKLPASAYLGAVAMWIAKGCGVRDIVGVRILDLILIGTLAATSYTVAELYLHSRMTAMMSFLLPLLSERFMDWTSGGTEPKLCMVLFGMLSLVLVAQDRPFLAGFASMLSCLCWQPGLLFTGAAFLVFSRYLTSWRDRRATKVLAGAVLPLAILLVYFYRAGALQDLWTWTISYTYHVYAPEGTRSLPDGLAHIWRVTIRVLGAGAVLLVLGAIGFLGFLYTRIVAEIRNRRASYPPSDFLKDGILIAPAVYFVFCLIDFKGGPYLIPLIPFGGIFTAWLVEKVSGMVPTIRSGRQTKEPRVPSFGWQALVLAAVFVLAFAIAAKQGNRGPGLREQMHKFESLAGMLGPDDKIYVHGSTEILVLLDKANLNPYIFLDSGKDDYLAARTNGGFKSIVDGMETQAPKLVALSRLDRVRHREELQEWVNERYEKVPLSGYDVYVRKVISNK
jgi:hypothetical protein